MSKQIDIAAEIGLTDSESSTPTATSPINVPPTPPDEETVARANSLKDQGNKFLTTGRYSQAAEKYSEAIALYPNAIYYSNRAQALIKLEAYGQAIADANEAIRYISFVNERHDNRTSFYSSNMFLNTDWIPNTSRHTIVVQVLTMLSVN